MARRNRKSRKQKRRDKWAAKMQHRPGDPKARIRQRKRKKKGKKDWKITIEEA